jgi:hypothetical protein
VIRERATALAVAVATKLQELRDVTDVKAELTQAKREVV